MFYFLFLIAYLLFIILKKNKLRRKIIINARFLTQEITGVQRFAIEISKELKKSNIPIEFVAPKHIIHKGLAKELKVKEIGFNLVNGHLWEQTLLPLYVLKNKGVLLSLCNTAPLILKNQIVTIHDLAFKVNPKWFSKKFTLVYNFLIPLIAKRSKHIITVSEASKREIIRYLRVFDSKVTVIYNAISSVFLEGCNCNNHFDCEYVLTVSSHHPRKNFENLITAFNTIKNKDLKLFVIGNFNKNFSANLEINENDKRIIFLSNISDEELVCYYRKASLFVYPSIYEGFGIPIIEAMCQGIPVCVSDIPVFREICGKNAVYFNPQSKNSIAKSIINQIEKPISNEILKQIKIETLEKYSWKSSANKLKSVLNSMYND